MVHSPTYSLKLASERRLENRLTATIPGQALEIGKARLPVTFRSLSRQGAMFEAEHVWRTGSRIWLFFRSGLSVNTKVIWTDKRQHGCEFLRPLSEGEFQLCLWRR